MFRNTSTAAIEPPAPVVVPPVDLIPLSVLGLDLSAPATGWEPFLTVRNIAIVVDDIGRLAVSRDDARTLIAEKHENERRAQEIARQQEQAAMAADQAFRAALPKGLPWYALPDGVYPQEAWAQAEKDAQPKRRTLLEDAFAREETLVYHSLRDEADES